jgi:hypothetical protein
MDRLARGFLSYWVTYSFIILHILVSLILIYFEPSDGYIGAFVRTFGSSASHFVGFHIIFSLLFRGVEVSIGSFEYIQWLLWSAAFQFVFRQICHLPLIGPSFIVFCPFVTFYVIHRPYLYFRFWRFHCKDTLLYSVAVAQYAVNDITQLPVEFLGCLASNLIWRVLIAVWRRLRRGQTLAAEPLRE